MGVVLTREARQFCTDGNQHERTPQNGLGERVLEGVPRACRRHLNLYRSGVHSELAALGAEKTLCDCSFRKGHSEWAQELCGVLSSLPVGASPAAGSRAGRAHRALSSQSLLSSCNVQSDMMLKSHPNVLHFPACVIPCVLCSKSTVLPLMRILLGFTKHSKY